MGCPIQRPPVDDDILVAKGSAGACGSDLAIISGVEQGDGFFSAAPGDRDFIRFSSMVTKLVNLKPNAQAVWAGHGHIHGERIGYIAGMRWDADYRQAVGEGDDIRPHGLLVRLGGEDVAVGIQQLEAQFGRWVLAVADGGQQFDFDIGGVFDGQFEFAGGPTGEVGGGHAYD